MSLWTLCESVVTATLAEVPGFAAGQAFGGSFDLSEVKRQSFRTPAVFVTCEGTTRTADGYHRAEMVMILVAKSTTAKERSPAVMALASKVLTWLFGQTFGDQQVKAGAQNVDSKNLYGAKADEAGVHLWAVTFTLDVDLDDDDELDELPDAEVMADWDLAVTDDTIEKRDELDLNP